VLKSRHIIKHKFLWITKHILIKYQFIIYFHDSSNVKFKQLWIIQISLKYLYKLYDITVCTLPNYCEAEDVMNITREITVVSIIRFEYL
jgi:hypothetical protein